MSEEPKTSAGKAAARKRLNARRIRTTAVAIASVLGVPVVLLQLLSLSCDTLGMFCITKPEIGQMASKPDEPAVPDTPHQETPGMAQANAESTAPSENTTAPKSPTTPPTTQSQPPMTIAAAPARVIPDKAWLGVRVEPVTSRLAQELFMSSAHGAYIASVAPESPGARAGLRQGDVISTFDGRVVQSADDLQLMVRNKKPSDKTSVEVIRKGLHSFLTIDFSAIEEISNADPGFL